MPTPAVPRIPPPLLRNVTTSAGSDKWDTFRSVLSILAYMLKAPMVPRGTPALARTPSAAIGSLPESRKRQRLEERGCFPPIPPPGS